MTEPSKKPFGERLRDVINPALDDDRRSDIQKKILDDAFAKVTDYFEDAMEAKFSHFFNHVARAEAKNPRSKNPLIIDALTATKEDGEPKYSPIMRLPLPICTAYTTFSADDIKDLPSYIRLHEKARDMDVSLKVTNLTADESKSPSGFQMPAVLIIDATKTYAEGAMENSMLYPNLKPKKAEFDGKSRGQFDL